MQSETYNDKFGEMSPHEIYPNLVGFGHARCSVVYNRLRNNVLRTLTHTVTDTDSIADVHFTLDYPMNRTQTWLLRLYFVLSSFQSTSVGGTQVLHQLNLSEILDLDD